MSSSLSTRIDHVERFVDKEITDFKSRLIAGDDEGVGGGGELQTLIGKSFDYMNDKFKVLKSAIPITIDELGIELEKKSESIRKESHQTFTRSIVECEDEIVSLKFKTCDIDRVFQEKLSLLENKYSTDVGALRQQVDKISNFSRFDRLELELREYKGKLQTCEQKLLDTNQKLEYVLSKINDANYNQNNSNSGFTSGESIRASCKQQKILDDINEVVKCRVRTKGKHTCNQNSRSSAA